MRSDEIYAYLDKLFNKFGIGIKLKAECLLPA